MPYLTLPPLSRRVFAATFAGAAVTLLHSANAEMRWALLSDTHIPADPNDAYRGFKPTDNLKKVAAEVAAAKPEGALICGDLARLQGLSGDYEHLKSLLAPLSGAIPMALALGNHDDRKNFLAAFGTSQPGAQTIPHRHVLIIENPLARFIVLDSLIEPNSVPGFLGKAQRTWLANYLQTASDLPTLVFVHHTLDDNDGSLLDAPRLFDIIKDHRQVKAIVYGHSHHYGYETWQGIHLINLPAVGYNFNDREPVGWVDAILRRDGGTFTLRAFGGNTEANGKSTSLTWR